MNERMNEEKGGPLLMLFIFTLPSAMVSLKLLLRCCY